MSAAGTMGERTMTNSGGNQTALAIGDGILSALGEKMRAAGLSGRVFVVTDKRVADLQTKVKAGIDARKQSEEFKKKQEQYGKASDNVFAAANKEGVDADTVKKAQTDLQTMRAESAQWAEIIRAASIKAE